MKGLSRYTNKNGVDGEKLSAKLPIEIDPRYDITCPKNWVLWLPQPTYLLAGGWIGSAPGNPGGVETTTWWKAGQCCKDHDRQKTLHTSPWMAGRGARKAIVARDNAISARMVEGRRERRVLCRHGKKLKKNPTH